jgi:hypothetical protein
MKFIKTYEIFNGGRITSAVLKDVKSAVNDNIERVTKYEKI